MKGEMWSLVTPCIDMNTQKGVDYEDFSTKKMKKIAIDNGDFHNAMHLPKKKQQEGREEEKIKRRRWEEERRI